MPRGYLKHTPFHPDWNAVELHTAHFKSKPEPGPRTQNSSLLCVDSPNGRFASAVESCMTSGSPQRPHSLPRCCVRFASRVLHCFALCRWPHITDWWNSLLAPVSALDLSSQTSTELQDISLPFCLEYVLLGCLACQLPQAIVLREQCGLFVAPPPWTFSPIFFPSTQIVQMDER